MPGLTLLVEYTMHCSSVQAVGRDFSSAHCSLVPAVLAEAQVYLMELSITRERYVDRGVFRVRQGKPLSPARAEPGFTPTFVPTLTLREDMYKSNVPTRIT